MVKLSRFGNALMAIVAALLFAVCAQASPQSLDGAWYLVRPYEQTQTYHQLLANPLQKQYPLVKSVRLTGGHYLYTAPFEITTRNEHVVDFKNTSTFEFFRHQVFDQQGHEVARMEGGLARHLENPFFLRHGRSFSLPPGKYTLATQLISTNYLAIPEPYIDEASHYTQAIKRGNALTLFCLGIFWGLGLYYTALATARNRKVEAMYALFIAGNFIYNSAALLVLSDIFGLHSIYFASMPILVSSIAYMLFVMDLLNINRYQHKRLFRAGQLALGLMVLFLLTGVTFPNWALECSRYGVALFLSYGLATAIRQSQRNIATAKRYLVAISLFFACGILTISLSKLNQQFDLYIEHLGLLSVAIEVILLALVLSFQFSELYKEKQEALEALGMTEKVANTDTLTGLPNRYALIRAMEKLSMNSSLTFIDIDGLKFYNDNFGHARGDELLICFARNYQLALGNTLTLYRLGGDEFAVLSPQGEVSITERAMKEAIEKMRHEGFEFSGASAGSAFYHEVDNIPAFMRLADARMYENKRSRQLR